MIITHVSMPTVNVNPYGFSTLSRCYGCRTYNILLIRLYRFQLGEEQFYTFSNLAMCKNQDLEELFESSWFFDMGFIFMYHQSFNFYNFLVIASACFAVRCLSYVCKTVKAKTTVRCMDDP